MSGRDWVDVLAKPTAPQSVESGQDTPESSSLSLGFFAVTLAQLVPFQASVRIWVLTDSLGDGSVKPTPRQSLEDEHDTPSSTPSGLARGVASTDQLVPFQSSANGTSEVPLEVPPTAMQLATLVHDTLARLTMSPELAPGVWFIDQAVPFHVSMSEAGPALSTPTATQNVALVHDTP